MKPGVDKLSLIRRAAEAERKRLQGIRSRSFPHGGISTGEVRKILDGDTTVGTGTETGTKTEQMDKPERKSRYINKLVVTAERRREEAERVNERRRVEQEREQGEGVDEERFVTSGYKLKLRREDQIRAQEMKKEREERVERIQGGMQRFSTRMITGGMDEDRERERDGHGDREKDVKERTRGKEKKKRKRVSRFADVQVEIVGKGGGNKEEKKKKKIYGVRRNDEKTIAAYRERYLQRKQRREMEEKTPS